MTFTNKLADESQHLADPSTGLVAVVDDQRVDAAVHVDDLEPQSPESSGALVANRRATPPCHGRCRHHRECGSLPAT